MRRINFFSNSPGRTLEAVRRRNTVRLGVLPSSTSVLLSTSVWPGYDDMTKSKKSSKPLTHEEIWDDSALVRSWDEAVEEYKVRENRSSQIYDHVTCR